MRNYSYGNEFVLHENEDAGKTHFHMNGFALRLVLTLRQKRTRKWSITGVSLHEIMDHVGWKTAGQFYIILTLGRTEGGGGACIHPTKVFQHFVKGISSAHLSILVAIFFYL